MTDVATSDTRGAVVRYADRLHRALPGGHRVTSPLGAWLVLALAAPAATGADRAALEAALGMPVDHAASAAGALLDDAHPAVAAAAAAWVRAGLGGPALAAWQAGLPAAVGHGDVPTQAGADAWTREHTLELIERFPVVLDPSVVFVLTSALATRVAWHVPYDLGPVPGAWEVGGALTSSDGDDRVLATPLGDVAVHTASADGLAVTSVIAPAGVPDVDVLDLAHRIVAGPDTFDRRSLFSLPLGESELWTVTEERGTADRETYTVELPAWEAESRHDLLAADGTGFPGLVAPVAQLLGAEGPAEAVQVALARYGREGFEAAAVTVFAMACSAMVPRPGRERHATLRFGHPYAVVATATRPDSATTTARGPWEGLPVFAAWVERASEPEAVRTGRQLRSARRGRTG